MANAETVEETEITEEPSSLSDMFNDSDESESEVTEETTEVAAEETDEDQGEPEADETEAKAEEPEADDKVAEPPTAEQGQLAALMAERDKRQKLEAELKELKSKAVPVPDPIEDPEGYAEYVEGKAENSDLQTRIKLSRSFMLDADPDFPRMEGVFMEMVADEDGNVIDQNLLTQFRNADNPAMFVRDHVKNHERIQKLSDPKYAENLEAEIRAKVLKEIEDEAAKGLSATDVPDLTTASGSKDRDQTGAITSIEAMFPES